MYVFNKALWKWCKALSIHFAEPKMLETIMKILSCLLTIK